MNEKRKNRKLIRLGGWSMEIISQQDELKLYGPAQVEYQKTSVDLTQEGSRVSDILISDLCRRSGWANFCLRQF